MTARHWLTLTIALCGSLAVTGAEAAKKGGAKAPPAVVGCTGQVVPMCFGVRTQKGARYALVDANPGHRRDRVGRGDQPEPVRRPRHQGCEVDAEQEGQVQAGLSARIMSRRS